MLFEAGGWDDRLNHLGLSATYATGDWLSLVIAPSFVFFERWTLIFVPVGFQVDVGLGLVPDLSLYGRAMLGPAFVATFDDDGAALLMFDAGVKYHVQDWWYVGVEPLSLPVFLNGDPRLIHKPAVVAGFSF